MFKKEDALVVVAIDFGTTYSGYAYSFRDEYKKDHAKIYSNEVWQSGDGLSTPKTPTAILFDENKTFLNFGYDAEQDYAGLSEDGIGKDYFYFTRFKMKLFQAEPTFSDESYPRVKKKDKISRDLMLEDHTGKPMAAITVFSECIRFLKDHFKTSVKVSQFDLKDRDIHWVLTIPAIWKDNAKQFMREAAQKAGILNEMLSLAYEPEAAAISCKEATVKKKEATGGCSLESFEPGQQFMVLDCGGGTIDITSYEIQNDSQLKEIDRPSGGPWGGTYVDQEYIKFLQVLFGSDVWKAFEKDAPEDVLEIKRKFEAKKRGTKHNDKTKTTIPYPQSLYSTYSKLKNVTDFGNTLRDSKFSKTVTKTNEKLRYNPEIIVEFFSKSTNSISSKVNELLSFAKRKGNHIEAILMVGGYSDSPILQERMRNDFKDLKIICPQDAVLAVVKGAVMFGHNPQLISERICPRTYGITINVPYDERKHPSKLKTIIEGKEMCSDVFKVMVKKGRSSSGW